jgi:hypothetical protein
VFILWANIHILFVYGLVVVGLLFAESLVERRPLAAGAGAILAACLAATLVSPYHVHLWRVVLDYARSSGVFDSILELKAPTFRTRRDWVMLAAVALGAYALGRRRERRLFPIALFALCVVLAFRARRDAWMVGVAVAAFLPGERRAERARPVPLGVLLGVGAVGLLVALGLRASDVRESRHEAIVAEAFPEKAARFIEQNDLPGPLYNPFNWGCWLMWRLPAYPVSMDGRTNLHGDERVQRGLLTCAARPGWQTDPELQGAKLVLLPNDYALVSVLLADPRWQLVHRDEMASVFARR